MSTNLTPTDIKRKKRTQSRISQTTGALGLASLGAFTAGRLGGTGKYAVKAQKAVPHLKRINTDKANAAALGTSTAGAGIGGVGSFNFAQYTRAEADKGKRVKKNFYGGIEMPELPSEGVNKAYDPERSRMKRSEQYQTGANMIAGGAATGAGHQGLSAYKQGRKLTRRSQLASVKPVAQSAGRAAALGAVAGGSAYAGRKMKQSSEKGSWKPYVAKSATSAFGITHD